eukprot:1160870-Pelagomonas_calceolata.AAC.5
MDANAGAVFCRACALPKSSRWWRARLRATFRRHGSPGGVHIPRSLHGYFSTIKHPTRDPRSCGENSLHPLAFLPSRAQNMQHTGLDWCSRQNTCGLVCYYRAISPRLYTCCKAPKTNEEKERLRQQKKPRAFEKASLTSNSARVSLPMGPRT